MDRGDVKVIAAWAKEPDIGRSRSRQSREKRTEEKKQKSGRGKREKRKSRDAHDITVQLFSGK